MKKDSRYIWFVADMIIYILINLWIWFYHTQALMLGIQRIDWTILILLTLGVWRITDVITHENVTDVLRAPFMEKTSRSDSEDWEVSKKGFKGFIGNLLSCNACLGVWVAMIAFYAYILYPTPTIAFMIIMTLTAFERIVSKIFNILEKRGGK